MDYRPIKLCDTAGMSEEDWLKMRQHGPHWDDPTHPDYLPYCVGGSTVAAIMGVSPWTTPLDVWEEKRGNKPDNPDEMNLEAKIAGHIWEDFVAQMVPHMEGYEKAVIINDTGFYQHPFYPFAVANLDRRIVNNGKEGILEIKTTSWQNFEKVKAWKAGIVPIYYEYQCRWYMAIMNLDYADIACSWGFRTTDMVIIHIERDKHIENMLLKEVAAFIKSIEDNEPPSMVDVDPELAMEALRRLYGSDKTLETVEFDPKKYFRTFEGLRDVLREEQELREDFNKKLDMIQRRKDMYSARICEVLKRADAGFVEQDGERIGVTYKTTVQHRIDTARLKREDPALFDKYTKVITFRTLKLEGDPE